MINKFFIFFLTIVLIFSLGITAYAAEDTYPVNAEWRFYDNFEIDSANLVYTKTLPTQYLAPGEEVYVKGVSPNYYFFTTVPGYEKMAWQGGLYMVLGGGNPDPFIYDGYLDVRGTMIAEPLDIIFEYSPYADYYYVNHYCDGTLVDTDKILGLIGESYTGQYKTYEDFNPVSATSGIVPLRTTGMAVLTLECHYESKAAPSPTPSPTPTPTPEVTATPTPTPESSTEPDPTPVDETPNPTSTPNPPTSTPKPVVTPTPKVITIIQPQPTPTPAIFFQEPDPETRIIYITSEVTPEIRYIESTPQVIYVTPTPEPVEIIEEPNAPLASFNNPTAVEEGDHWALVNLILMLCSALGMIKFEDKKKYNVFNIMFAVASILVFVFTENTFLPMALVDKYTLFMIALFIGEALSHILMFKKKQENKEEA